MEWTSVVRLIDESGADAEVRLRMLDTLHKVALNAVLCPQKRRLRKANGALRAAVLDPCGNAGALALETIGFVDSGESYLLLDSGVRLAEGAVAALEPHLLARRWKRDRRLKLREGLLRLTPRERGFLHTRLGRGRREEGRIVVSVHLFDGRRLTLEVRSTTTVGGLKHQIQTGTGIPRPKQNVFLLGREEACEDTQTVASTLPPHSPGGPASFFVIEAAAAYTFSRTHSSRGGGANQVRLLQAGAVALAPGSSRRARLHEWTVTLYSLQTCFALSEQVLLPSEPRAYFEIQLLAGCYPTLGVVDAGFLPDDGGGAGGCRSPLSAASAAGWGLNSMHFTLHHCGKTVPAALHPLSRGETAPQLAAGDRLGVLLRRDHGSLEFYRNGRLAKVGHCPTGGRLRHMHLRVFVSLSPGDKVLLLGRRGDPGERALAARLGSLREGAY